MTVLSQKIPVIDLEKEKTDRGVLILQAERIGILFVILSEFFVKSKAVKIQKIKRLGYGETHTQACVFLSR